MAVIINKETKELRIINSNNVETDPIWNSQKNNYYTKTEVDNALSTKSDVTHNHNLADLAEKSYNSLTDTPDLSSLHTHSNKALLDEYTQTNEDLADAVSKKHTHQNKELLDTLTSSGSGDFFLSADGTYRKIKSTINFDAIIAQDCSGDYTDIVDAWNDGHRSFLIKPGEYYITQDLEFQEYENKNIAFVAQKPGTVKIYCGIVTEEGWISGRQIRFINTKDYLNPPQFTRLRGTAGEYYIYAENSNITSQHIGTCLFDTDGSWYKQHYVIKNVEQLDETTTKIHVKDLLLYSFDYNFDSSPPFIFTDFTKPILLDGIIFENLDVFFNNYGYVFTSQLIVNNCELFGSSLNYDSYGYNWIIMNSIVEADIYAPIGSIWSNCKGRGVYSSYSPYTLYIGCYFSRSWAIPNAWDLSGAYNNYIGCWFTESLPQDYVKPETVNISSCFFNGVPYS